MRLRAQLRRRRLNVLGPIEAPAAPAHPRPVRAVRLSVTDRCDLACSYCRLESAPELLWAREKLTPSDWGALVRALVGHGVSRVRLTGGEPLVHPKIVEIVERVAAVPGVCDLALSTNGVRLAPLAGALRAAGLQRLNVSVPSASPDRFRELTGGGRLEDVVAGLEAARAAGFEELKTNTLVVRAVPGAAGNEDELVDIARWAWSAGLTPRFLELMPVGSGAYDRDRFVPYARMYARLAGLVQPTPAARRSDRGPALYFPARDGSARTIGFITGVTRPFCADCDRLRVTSDGFLRPCLATRQSVEVRAAVKLRDRAAMSRAIEAAWACKPDGRIWQGCAEESAARVCMRTSGA